ncbi:hypothetical protein [Frateuria sp. YIM B11624]|uniref:hypothetical protein n=1 Tax=Frateuria sp. YIM B11624 TaxID=3143185 RepID=UPI003C7174A5
MELHALRNAMLTRWKASLDALCNASEAWGWLVLVVACANVTAFVVNYSNPVVSSDAWYFLDTFVRKALDGTLTIGDYFARRVGLDHAQPLRKLILLGELNYFHLDFRTEAMLGVACALLCLLMIRKVMRWVDGPAVASPVLLWAAAITVVFSLNSSGVWTWPLVCSAYTTYVLLFAFCMTLWRGLANGTLGWLILSALILDLAADDTAMLATAAAWLALGVVALRSPQVRPHAWKCALVLLLCLVVGRIALAMLYHVPDYASMPLGARVAKLASAFVDGGWWQWWAIPLASSVAYILPLQSMVGDGALAVQLVIGALLALAHLWFWWRALRKSPINAPMFVGVLLMLFFYALLAGIIYGRIPTYGNGYLNQSRYVMFYGFNLIALLLMCAGDMRTVQASTRAKGFLVASACIALVALQLPYSAKAWRSAPYGSLYHQKMARQIWYMADHGTLPPEKCLPLLTVCGYSEQTRKDLIHMLQVHRLNVFSPEFQRANRMMRKPPPY